MKIEQRILDDLEYFLIQEIFYEELGTLIEGENDTTFDYSMESILKELSFIEKQIERKTTAQIINELLIQKNIQRPSALYNKVNITRSHWNKLISNRIKEPTLRVLYKLAVGFNLSVQETFRFLKNFNRTFSEDSNMRDQIVFYFISREIYNPDHIEEALSYFNEETIFYEKD